MTDSYLESEIRCYVKALQERHKAEWMASREAIYAHLVAPRGYFGRR